MKYKLIYYILVIFTATIMNSCNDICIYDIKIEWFINDNKIGFDEFVLNKEMSASTLSYNYQNKKNKEELNINILKKGNKFYLLSNKDSIELTKLAEKKVIYENKQYIIYNLLDFSYIYNDNSANYFFTEELGLISILFPASLKKGFFVFSNTDNQKININLIKQLKQDSIFFLYNNKIPPIP